MKLSEMGRVELCLTLLCAWEQFKNWGLTF